MLVRASNLLVNNSKQRISRISNLTKGRKRESNVFNEINAIAKQSSILSRDSEANLEVDEDETGVNSLLGIGRSVHRCSMIKKYNIDTFFTPAKQHRRAITTELKAENQGMFDQINGNVPPSNQEQNDVNISRSFNLPDKTDVIDEESMEQSQVSLEGKSARDDAVNNTQLQQQYMEPNMSPQPESSTGQSFDQVIKGESKTEAGTDED